MEGSTSMIPKSNPRYITEQLRRLRKESKMGQFDFAELTGYDRGVLALYETGKRTPNLKVVADLADALGYNLTLDKHRKRRKVRPNKYFNGMLDDPEIALYYMELGYRGSADGLSLGEVFRRCPTVNRVKTPPKDASDCGEG
jgi:transcriptional regulator with XRE-family HTH domain